MFPERSTHRVLADMPPLKAHEPWDLLEVETLELHADPARRNACCCMRDLEGALAAVESFARASATNDAVVPVVVLAAMSNVTGCALDVPCVNELIHRYGGVACWDIAAMAAHKHLDFKYLPNSPLLLEPLARLAPPLRVNSLFVWFFVCRVP